LQKAGVKFEYENINQSHGSFVGIEQ